jgi:DsbC/DsbD-like thiol-disulfide interchange protein
MIFSGSPATFGIFLSVLALAAAPAQAAESNWSDSGKAKVRLIAVGAPSAGAPIRAGIEIRLDRGWHTYWRYAGDAGIPPRFDWSRSVNLATADVLWPAPQRIAVEDGIESIGYKDAVLLPLRIKARDPAKPVMLRLKLDFGVCEKICIPASADVALDAVVNAGQSFPALDRSEASVPATAKVGDHGALRIAAAKIERGKNATVVVDVEVPPGRSFDLFAEDPADRWSPPLPQRKSAKNGRARFVIALEDEGSSPPLKNLRLTLVSGENGIEVLAPLD